MFLHESLSSQKFKNNKKLNLLKQGLITPGQFLSLIEPTDPFIILGSAIIDKDEQQNFIKQWKNNIHNITPIEQKQKVTTEQFINNLQIVKDNFNQTSEIINQFISKLSSASCKMCTKNRYLLIIASIIKEHINDGRQFSSSDKLFFDKIINKYFPFSGSKGKISLDAVSYYDNSWIKPDSLVNIGYDLIQGLNNCFECTKKHLSRAKVFYNQLYLGYPQHIQLLFNEFTEANKDIEQAYVLYWDALGELDMASCQLVGQITTLQSTYREQIIELANKIRTSRINYQQDIKQVPNWDQLRIDIQRLQNKINKQAKE